MAEKTPQTYANHRRFIPLYHGGVGLIFTLHLAGSIWLAAQRRDVHSFFLVLFSAALILFFLYARLFALTAQDRVIRLEERLRLATLLPADLKPRIAELSPGQLIALRFASDDEIPALVRKVLDEKIGERDAIKKLIKNWRADYLRV
jgi:hypothetical protein